MLSVIMPSVIMLSVVILGVIMLSVVMLGVVMLNVTWPLFFLLVEVVAAPPMWPLGKWNKPSLGNSEC